MILQVTRSREKKNAVRRSGGEVSTEGKEQNCLNQPDYTFATHETPLFLVFFNPLEMLLLPSRQSGLFLQWSAITVRTSNLTCTN